MEVTNSQNKELEKANPEEPTVSKKIPKSNEEKQLDSLALAGTFICLGFFLVAFPGFFGDEGVTAFIRWVFIILGAIGFFSSFGEKGDLKSKGMGEIGAGIILLSIAYACALFIPIPIIAAVTSFLFMILGMYGLMHGALFIGSESIKQIKTNRIKKQGSVALSVIELVTKVVGLTLVITQLSKAFFG